MRSISSVTIFSNGQSFKFENRNKLKLFIVSLFKNEGSCVKDIKYIFCSDNELLMINKKILNHNFYTDIITFTYSADKSGVVAEIYISIKRVRENSKLFSVSFNNELLRVIFHGALHLCGYKDTLVKNRKKMQKMEDYYLNLYLANPSTFHVKQ